VVPFVWQASADSEPTVDPEEARRRAEAEEEERMAALRAHGTPVTAETFAAWRKHFEADMQLIKLST
jgi:hypothetical protein